MASLASTASVINSGAYGHVTQILVTNPGDTGTGGEISHLGPLGVAPDEVVFINTSLLTAGNAMVWCHTATNTTTGTVTIKAVVEGGGTIVSTATTTVLVKWYAGANQDKTSLDDF